MKPCPFCGSEKAKFEPFTKEVECGYVVCECGGFGPSADSEAEAVAKWDAAYRPRTVPAENHHLTLVADGTEYLVSFMHVGAVTFCGIVWNDHGKQRGTYGASYCNPKDVFDTALGEKIAMKKACGVGLPGYACWAKLSQVYRCYRIYLHGNEPTTDMETYAALP